MAKKIYTKKPVVTQEVEAPVVTPPAEEKAVEEIAAEPLEAERCNKFDYAGDLSFKRKPFTQIIVNPADGVVTFVAKFKCTAEEITEVFALGK
jgi:hypothetical protein